MTRATQTLIFDTIKAKALYQSNLKNRNAQRDKKFKSKKSHVYVEFPEKRAKI